MKPPATVKGVNDENDEKEDDIVVKPSSNKEVLEALEVLRRAVQHRSTNFNMQYYKVYCQNSRK